MHRQLHAIVRPEPTSLGLSCVVIEDAVTAARSEARARRLGKIAPQAVLVQLTTDAPGSCPVCA